MNVGVLLTVQRTFGFYKKKWKVITIWRCITWSRRTVFRRVSIEELSCYL